MVYRAQTARGGSWLHRTDRALHQRRCPIGEVNPWLKEKLKVTHSPETISLLVEATDPRQMDAISGDLTKLGIPPVGWTFNMLLVTAPLGKVQDIAAIRGVRIHYNAPKYIKSPPRILDPLLGTLQLSPIEIPFTREQMMARFGPNLLTGVATLGPRLLQQFLRIKTPGGSIQNPDVIIVPTGETRKFLELPQDNKMSQTRVCVLDTGVAWPHPLFHPSKGMLYLDSTIEQPAWMDGLGHGTWVTTCAFGDSANTRFGLCQGVADPENGTLGVIKCLSTAGFGTSFSVLQAMEKAWKWGARVVNMSLGGPLQGGVDFDPECQIIERLAQEVIFVVAAGNEGPDPWTIGSPGASPYALTVGAWSPVYQDLAIFSSRGPSGEWYRDHPEDYRRDYGKYGAALVKPDVLAPGGGPAQKGQKTDIIYSGVVGWTDGMYDFTPLDLFEGMRGTSMSSPAVAGLVALAYERGLVKTAAQVKGKMIAAGRSKDDQRGYGLITWPMLLG